jgi:hypothetical protein
MRQTLKQVGLAGLVVMLVGAGVGRKRRLIAELIRRGIVERCGKEQCELMVPRTGSYNCYYEQTPQEELQELLETALKVLTRIKPEALL